MLEKLAGFFMKYAKRTKSVVLIHVWQEENMQKLSCKKWRVQKYPGVAVSKNIKRRHWTNIVPRFRACAIVPYNPEDVPKEAYLPHSLHSVTYLMNIDINKVIMDNTCSKSTDNNFK